MVFDLSIIGNVTKAPEKRVNNNGKQYALFSVAVNRPNRQTVFVRVKAWGELGENCAKYLVKGRQVYVNGQLEEPYAYINNQNIPVASLTVNANNVTFLSGVVDQTRGNDYQNNNASGASNHSEDTHNNQSKATETPPVEVHTANTGETGASTESTESFINKATQVALETDDLPF